MTTLFEAIGGQATVEALVDRFYHIMSTDPVAKDCFATHQGKDISDSAHKLKYFLSGWLGGPQLYLEKYGHPRLRMRHAHFQIGLKEAEQWLYCMKMAMASSSINPEIQAQLYSSFLHVAQMLINSQD